MSDFYVTAFGNRKIRIESNILGDDNSGYIGVQGGLQLCQRGDLYPFGIRDAAAVSDNDIAAIIDKRHDDQLAVDRERPAARYDEGSPAHVDPCRGGAIKDGDFYIRRERIGVEAVNLNIAEGPIRHVFNARPAARVVDAHFSDDMLVAVVIAVAAVCIRVYALKDVRSNQPFIRAENIQRVHRTLFHDKFGHCRVLSAVSVEGNGPAIGMGIGSLYIDHAAVEHLDFAVVLERTEHVDPAVEAGLDLAVDRQRFASRNDQTAVVSDFQVDPFRNGQVVGKT